MIESEAKAKYLQDGGNHCPYCGSNNIVSGPIQYDDDLKSETICLGCNKMWIDFYKIADVI